MAKFLFSLFLVYVVLEGAFRKWIFPSLSTPLFLLKDAFLLLAGVAWFLRRATGAPSGVSFTMLRERLLWFGWIAFFCLYALISGASGGNLVGLRYYLIMLPLVALVPSVLNNMAGFETAARKYFYLLLPVGLIGIVQYYSPPDAFINRYAWSNIEMAVAIFGQNKPRITGTFSYITPYTTYLQFMVFVGWCLYLGSSRPKDKLLVGAGQGLIFVNMAMSGSRGPFGTSILFSLPFLLALIKKVAVGRRRVLTVLTSAIVVFCSAYLIWDPFMAVSERHRTAQDAPARILGAVLGPLYTIADMDLAGIGIGETFLGGQEMTGERSDVKFEEVTQDRIGIETGIAGFALALVVKVYFLYQTWRLYRNAASVNIRKWALASLLYQASLGWGIPVYNSVAAAYYFLCVGLFYWLRLQQRGLSAMSATTQDFRLRGRRIVW